MVREIRQEQVNERVLHSVPVRRLPGSVLPDPAAKKVIIRLGVVYLPPVNQIGDEYNGE